jgi:hypothetical protein
MQRPLLQRIDGVDTQMDEAGGTGHGGSLVGIGGAEKWFGGVMAQNVIGGKRAPAFRPLQEHCPSGWDENLASK